MKKETLEQIKANALENMSDYAKGFVKDYEGQEIDCLSDAFNKFADSQTSGYYSDQRDYYLEHADECDDVLYELYGSNITELFKQCGNSLKQLICRAGVLGEFEAIYQELCDNEQYIKEYLIASLALKEDKCEELEEDHFEELVSRYTDAIEL